MSTYYFPSDAEIFNAPRASAYRAYAQDRAYDFGGFLFDPKPSLDEYVERHLAQRDRMVAPSEWDAELREEFLFHLGCGWSHTEAYKIAFGHWGEEDHPGIGGVWP